MQFLKEEECCAEQQLLPPVSPNGLFFNSSAVSLVILAVFETEEPISLPSSRVVHLLDTRLLPVHPRFSSIIVTGEDGVKRWEKVEVNVKDHIKTPVFPEGKSPEFYDRCFQDYFHKISGEKFPEGRPLWEFHLVKYPTLNAAGNVIFKIHHAIGDGYSLMAAMISCFTRSDDHSLPLTFPKNRIRRSSAAHGRAAFLSRGLTSAINTASDMWFSFSKTKFSEDDLSPIRSGDPAVGSRPVSVVTMTFPLDDVKEIKGRLGVTVNDVMTGTIFLGTRLYMQEMDPGSQAAETTAMVLMNTRMLQSYNSIQEMAEPKTTLAWGNHFAFLHITVPKLIGMSDGDELRSRRRALEFVRTTSATIQKKRFSLAISLTAKLLDLYRKLKGHEATASYLYKALKSTSMAVTNMVGPLEQMALADQPVKGMYFVVAGTLHDVFVTIVSYMGQLRVSVVAEKGFIDHDKLKSCIQMAFHHIYESSCH
ncbi:unnamed protein product [Linum tenue]|uniref:Diacylglycerol O-acyltransferase n=1 Tax=Linum tenue TaxID=586396 RepID=A0AAV0MUA0_9ROSI|nr:unnamed protein product [Linum tenue]